MAKAGSPGSGDDRRARIAAQRAADQRAARRNRILLAGGAVVVVVGVVLGLVLANGGGSPSSPGTATPGPTGTALTAVTSQLTSVPAAALDQAGAGEGVRSLPTSITGDPLTSGGKPEMLYIGAEYCPYCAAERWPMIVALSRFGTFSGLTTIRSAAHNGAGVAEPYPNTPTWTFYKSTYTSSYLTFTPVEEYTNIPDPSTGGYTTLMNLTDEQKALISKYDAANQGAIPFIDFGNKFISVGASYDPNLLKNLTWAQIAADLHDPSTPVAKAVLGTANYATAALCELTGNKPASACTATVRALQAKI
jgi:hypothetical protein